MIRPGPISGRSPIGLYQHGVIHVSPKRVINGPDVGPEAVRCDLYTPPDAGLEVLDKLPGCLRRPLAHCERGNQLAHRVQGNKDELISEVPVFFRAGRASASFDSKSKSRQAPGGSPLARASAHSARLDSTPIATQVEKQIGQGFFEIFGVVLS